MLVCLHSNRIHRNLNPCDSIGENVVTPSLKAADEVGLWLASAGEVGQWLASADGCSSALLEAVMWPGSGSCSQSSDFTRANVSLESDYFCPITEEKPLKGSTPQN